LGGFEPAIDRNVAGFVELIDSKYISQPDDYRPMDLAVKCNYFALDVISELGFGAAFGFLKEDKDLYQYNAITRQFFPFVMFMANVPSLLDMLGRWPLTKMGPTAGDANGFGRLMGYVVSFREQVSRDGALTITALLRILLMADWARVPPRAVT
jgi:hypothetical protein